MRSDSRIFISGHRGLVGSAIVRRLRCGGFSNLILRERRELDLIDSTAVKGFFESERPEYVFMAAARVGGIGANIAEPVAFLRDNLAIEMNTIEAAYRSCTRKLLFLASSCIYPRDASQPMTEDSLLTGLPEPTNEPYALAKIAGIKLCQAYRRQYGFDAISIVPSNIYGPEDNFSVEAGHVVPALIRKFHEAKLNRAGEVEIWGTGAARREFLHSDDLADACVYLMQRYASELIVNVGQGQDVTISELAEAIAGITGFTGKLRFDSSKPDGSPRKRVDTTRLQRMGWTPKIDLESGIRMTFEWFVRNIGSVRL